MSKKIMKRSLALGALMAFVITGSAWAYTDENGNVVPGADESKITDSDIITTRITEYDNIADSDDVVRNKKIVGIESVTQMGGVFKATEKVTFDNCVFMNNSNVAKTGQGYGGVIYISPSGGDATVKNSTFKNNYVESKLARAYGAAIENDGGKLTVENSFFTGNTAQSPAKKPYGVVIYMGRASASTSITNTSFVNNGLEEGSGLGIIYMNAGTLNLTNVTFENTNGARYCDFISGQTNTGADTNKITIYGKKNSFSGTNGRAIFNRGILTFAEGSETEFKNNNVDITNVAGGVINIDERAKVTLSNCINAAAGNGTVGTININGGTLNGQIDTYTDESKGITYYNKLVFNDNAKQKSGTWNLTGESKIAELGGTGGVINFVDAKAKLEVPVNTNSGVKFTATSVVNEAVNGDANKLISKVAWAENTTIVMDPGDIVGEVTAELVKGKDGNLVVKSQTEVPNPANQAISDSGVGLKLHYRYHMNDMNKRMGELRNANGEYGVWTRMVRGESEYDNSKAQYNQYQLGYDEKLSVDKRWTVGAAVTFSEGDSSYGYGSTEDKSTAFAIYGSKLNNDGTFVDLIARYAHLESDIEDKAGKGDYSTNGMSVSAEFGKRIQQGNGLWIEPQFELTYGNIDSAEFQIGGKTVQVGDMDSLIGRVGFSLGKDIKQGNVYARASYLYDFDGETETAFSNDSAERSFKEDLGDGWWEVGVGANINLSKATYVYADVEKTFGGEVDTNWQWNLGVRYSF